MDRLPSEREGLDKSTYERSVYRSREGEEKQERRPKEPTTNKRSGGNESSLIRWRVQWQRGRHPRPGAGGMPAARRIREEQELKV